MRFLKGTRVPRKHGVPLMTSASIVITGSAIGSSHFSFLGKLGRYPSRRGRTLRGRTPLFPAITQLTRSSFYATIKNHVPEIELLVYRRGERTPFVEWLAGLNDARAVGTVRARLNRVRLGNLGDCRSLGEGGHELRIDFGPGFRVYFGRQGSSLVVLLTGGDKKTQARDIAAAKKFWKEYLNAQNNREDGALP